MEKPYDRCLAICERAQSVAVAQNRKEKFEPFLECMENLDTQTRRACKIGYAACVRKVPPEFFRK